MVGKLVAASNQNGLSRDTATILWYTDVTGVVHPGTDLLGLPSWGDEEEQFLCIVQKFQQYYNKKCTRSSMQWLAQPKQCS